MFVNLSSVHSPFLTMAHAVYAAGLSGSLSLIATGIDSVFDLGSNIMLFWLHRKATRLDVNKWPVGGARVTTIGNVIYGIIPSPSSVVVPIKKLNSTGFL
jgi:divalent metal cation (Fe/Co/Zn/Cd) transporter